MVRIRFGPVPGNLFNDHIDAGGGQHGDVVRDGLALGPVSVFPVQPDQLLGRDDVIVVHVLFQLFQEEKDSSLGAERI